MDDLKRIKSSRVFGPTGLKKIFHFRNFSAARQPNLKNEEGFALVLLLSLLPMIVSGMFCILALSWFFCEKEKIQMTCERKNLAAQNELIDGANRLIALNPRVEALVLEKRMAEIEVAASVTPVDKAAAVAHLMIVRMRILALRAQQLLLIRTSEALALEELARIELAARSEAQHITSTWNAPRALQSITHFELPVMQVDPHFSDPMIPTYRIPENFSRRQTIDVDILIAGPQPFPKWIDPLWKGTFHWQENCSSHPQRGGFGWQSHLGRARP